MEIGLSACAEDPRTGSKRVVCSAFFSFVAIDGNGRTTKVGPGLSGGACLHMNL